MNTKRISGGADGTRTRRVGPHWPEVAPKAPFFRWLTGLSGSSRGNRGEKSGGEWRDLYNAIVRARSATGRTRTAIAAVFWSLSLAGCVGTYLDLSAGPKVNPPIRQGDNWFGKGPIVEIAVRKEWERGVFCQYAHTSNLGSGPPFNNDRETTLDRVTCGKSFRLR